MTSLLSPLRVILTAGLAGLAAWSFRPAFDADAGSALLLAILVPVAVVAGWGCLAALFGRRLLDGGATALLLALMVAAVAVSTRPGIDARLGPSRLLTGALPAGASGPELATIGRSAGSPR